MAVSPVFLVSCSGKTPDWRFYPLKCVTYVHKMKATLHVGFAPQDPGSSGSSHCRGLQSVLAQVIPRVVTLPRKLGEQPTHRRAVGMNQAAIGNSITTATPRHMAPPPTGAARNLAPRGTKLCTEIVSKSGIAHVIRPTKFKRIVPHGAAYTAGKHTPCDGVQQGSSQSRELRTASVKS